MDQALPEIQSTVTIPFYDTEEMRPYSAAHEVGYKHAARNADQQLVNCYAEKIESPLTKNAEYYVTKRPGINKSLINSTLQTNWDGLFSSTCRIVKDHMAITQQPDSVAAAVFDYQSTAAGGNFLGKLRFIIYEPEAGTVTSWDLSGASFLNANIDHRDNVWINEFSTYTVVAPPAPVANSVTVTIVWQKYDRSASKAFYVTFNATWGGSTMTMITSTSFPTDYTSYNKVLAGNFAMLNGRAHIMTTDGYIFSSKVGDMSTGTGWVGNSFIAADSMPDGGVGLLRYKHHLVAFGFSSIEFFNDVGNEAGSPLEPTEQAFIKFGTPNANAMVNIDDTLYWFGSSQDGTNGIWKLEGYSPVEVTPAAYKRYLNNSEDFSVTDGMWRGIGLKSFFMNGKRHLCINGMYDWVQHQFFRSIDYERSGGAGYPTDSTTGPMIPLTSGTLCYSIMDQTWWTISGAWQVKDATLIGAPYLPAIYPAMPLYTKITEYGATKEYLRVGQQLILTASGFDIMSVQDEAGGSDVWYKDWNGTANLWIPVMCITNPLRFDKTARKRCAKAVLVCDRFYPFQSTPYNMSSESDRLTGQAYLDAYTSSSKYNRCMLFWTDNGGRNVGSMYSLSSNHPDPGDGTLSAKTCSYRVKDVYWDDTFVQWTRLGAFRDRTWGVIIFTPYEWRGKGLELFLTQGVS